MSCMVSIRDARGDDFRSVVSGWISEDEAGIGDVKEKLGRVEDGLVPKLCLGTTP